jgi:hypothetical protein
VTEAPDIARMELIVSKAGETIMAGACESDIPTRAEKWKKNLRSACRQMHYRKRVGPLWPVLRFAWQHLGVRQVSQLLGLLKN